MVSIARKNLLEDIPRFLVAQAGIMFAASLVTIQTGILNGFTRSTVLLIEGSTADIWVASEEMVQFELTEPLIVEQLEQAKVVEGVQSAEALTLGFARWKPPEGETSPLKIVGFEPDGELLKPGNITQGSVEALNGPYTVMVDESRLPSLEVEEIGAIAQVNSFPAELVGLTEESQSIVSSTFLYTSLENANAYVNGEFSASINCKLEADNNIKCTTVYESSEDIKNIAQPEPLISTDPITYILVKAAPGQNIETLKQNLEDALPGTAAYTTAEMALKTRNYWQMRTSLGLVLGIGAAVGVIVGMVVVSQILYSSVSDHIKEFGTLKAMGASSTMIYSVVMEQSLWMAVLGYIPGMILCWGFSLWAATQGIIILITIPTAVGVFGIVSVMCLGSGLLAIQKVTRVDPAIVFKA